MPASALARLAGLRHHRAECHQIAGGVVEHLRRQFLWSIDAGGLAFGMIETGCGLHQRVEAAAFRPWPSMAVSRQRDIDDAGRDLGRILRREAERGDRARAITLRE